MSETRKKKRKGLRLLLLTLGMLLLIGALILVMYLQDQKKQAEESAKESSSFVLMDLWDHEEDELSSIEVEREDETVTIFAREGNGDVIWYQEEYPEASLNSELYPNMVSLGCKLSVYQIVREPAEKSELASFGLDKPYARVRISLKDGTSHTILVGDVSSTGNYVYILEEETGNIYSAGKNCRTYLAYTSDELYLTDIADIYTNYVLSYLFVQKKGEPAIEISSYDSSKDPDNYFKSRSIYRFLQPYDFTSVGVDTALQSNFLDDLEKISIHEIITIQAKDEDLEDYGLGVEPEYRVNVVTCNEESDGEIKEFTTDYLFGYTYGSDNQYIYFRQNGENIVYGVDVASLEQFTFVPQDYTQKLVFLSDIKLLRSGTLTIGGQKFMFDLRQEKDESDNIEYQVRVNERDVDTAAFKTALQNLFLIMHDTEIRAESVDYDPEDKIEATYQFRDGTEKKLTFYRYNEFSYVIKIQDGLWMTCSYYQFKTLQQSFEALMATE